MSGTVAKNGEKGGGFAARWAAPAATMGTPLWANTVAAKRCMRRRYDAWFDTNLTVLVALSHVELTTTMPLFSIQKDTYPSARFERKNNLLPYQP